MKHRIVRWLTGMLLAVVLLSGAAHAVELKIATVAPEGSPWMRDMRQGAEEIRVRTEGRVVLRLYGGGVMGNEKSVFRKIRVGQLHGGAFTSGGLAEVYPDARLYGLPLVFRSAEELDFVRARMDDKLMAALEDAGFVNFGFAGAGFANIMSGVPIRTLGDLRGQKIWVPEGDAVSYTIMEALGLSPVSLPITDVMTGLQTGLINIVGTSPMGAIAFQWHTRIKFVTDTPLAYLYATLVIDRRVFSRISPADQQVVREVMERIYGEFDRQNRIENSAAAQALVQQGLVFLEAPRQEVDNWRQTAMPVIQRLGDQGAFSPVLLEKIQVYLAEFRREG
jgi:TRAP-type transport system periplasmic protein